MRTAKPWLPGDVVLVNAGYAYPPLHTYWSGTIAQRSRLTDPLPQPREDGALVTVTTGHVDGVDGLGCVLGGGLSALDFCSCRSHRRAGNRPALCRVPGVSGTTGSMTR